ncbi:Pre-mRNA-splicing factor cwf25 [Zancudomyces culisetae]|uniref:Pre-mRNA-splicing factor cwf25 n=1 Tax=Zancudomyces culisetae TaxID=1213189 RepID=A0A1R1PZ76_ZANCU|nr:Pre-mRNA-splicing factor cwf25 [Zancudomyces culisetae]|eukprot:OMH86246.1 Pre-mRNA-splicing factor cwf25 [Zancudomyces culisetae]
MGGGDLNLKKSWHPLTYKNQERIWKEKQKAEAERKKIEQMQKELAREKEREEFQRLQEATGHRKASNRLEWMYTAPTANGGQPVSEELEAYLLGKKSIDKILVAKAENELQQLDDKFKVTGGAKGFEFSNRNANNERDTHAKNREDPLFMIRQKEKEVIQSILKNPLKMNEIHKKNEAKKRLKTKENGKDKGRDRDRDRDRDREDRGDRKERKHRRHKEDERDRDGKREKNKTYKGETKQEKDNDRYKRRRHEDTDSDTDQHLDKNKRDRKYSDENGEEKRHYESSRHRRYRGGRSRSASQSRSRSPVENRYGSKSSHSSKYRKDARDDRYSSHRNSHDHTGSRGSQTEKRQYSRDGGTSYSDRIKKNDTSANSHDYEQERKERREKLLLEMTKNAHAVEKSRKDYIEHIEKEETKESKLLDEERIRHAKRGTTTKYLEEVTNSVYNNAGATTLYDRLQQRKTRLSKEEDM